MTRIKLQFVKPAEVHHFNDKATVVKVYVKLLLPNLNDKLMPHATFEGKAKVSPNDTFNPKKGAMIAESKARIKAYKWAKRICVDLYNFSSAKAEAALTTKNNLESYIETEVNHLKVLSEE